MRSMETLLDANRALTNDLPQGFLKRDHWLAAGKLLVHASETGAESDVQRATDELVKAVEREGWMSRVRAERPVPNRVETVSVFFNTPRCWLGQPRKRGVLCCATFLRVILVVMR